MKHFVYLAGHKNLPAGLDLPQIGSFEKRTITFGRIGPPVERNVLKKKKSKGGCLGCLNLHGFGDTLCLGPD